ncbi:hypothetical protein G7054_g441 [Neopestalotiopsis clavispora]|nr:hypothetical protein G7054_g441 [Neopestalotiopsis clavispora]
MPAAAGLGTLRATVQHIAHPCISRGVVSQYGEDGVLYPVAFFCGILAAAGCDEICGEHTAVEYNNKIYHKEFVHGFESCTATSTNPFLTTTLSILDEHLAPIKIDDPPRTF